MQMLYQHYLSLCFGICCYEVQENQKGCKLKGTHQHQVYSDDDDNDVILKTQALLIAHWEVSQEPHSEKRKYTFISHH